MKIYAIVPIKHNSSRVPGKNYRLMNGKPLYHYILETLLKSKYISKVLVDTNSPIIKEGLQKDFPSVVIYDRPEHLWPGDTSTNTLLMNIISDMNLDADLYVQTHTTNPLLKVETLDGAIDKFIESQDKYDSLFSVKTHHTRFYDSQGRDMNHNRFKLIPTQDLDPIYEENSCIYVFPKETLFKYEARIGPNALLYPIDEIESQDIDWENDFILTEQIMKYMNN